MVLHHDREGVELVRRQGVDQFNELTVLVVTLGL
jgi:hypothetical protein